MTYVKIQIDMQSYCQNLKSFFKQNQEKIVLCLGVFLIALIAFGLGRLSKGIGEKLEPIVIENAEIFKAQIGETIINQSEEIKEGIFVGSRNSNLYHLPTCSAARKIKKENEIWFKSVEEAQKKSYKPHSCIPLK